MKTRTKTGLLSFYLCGVVVIFHPAANGAVKTWNNGGTDFNATGNWTGGVPGSADTATFDTAASMQPNISSNITIKNLNFAATGTGYDLTSSNTSIALTLVGTQTGATTAAIASQNATGNTIIDAPLVLGAAAGSVQQFTQANGGTLTLNGVISGAGATNTLNLTSTGNFVFNGANTYSGTTTQANGSNIVIGNKSAFGTSTLNLTANGGNLIAGVDLTGANQLTNAITWGANATISNSGVFGIEFGGNVDLAGAARTINSNISGGATFDGVISNDGGGGLAFILANGSNVTLKGASTYTGKTTISGNGTVSVSAIGNTGVSGNLGAGPIVELGSTNKSGTLVYTGAGETTNRTVNLGGTTGGATIDTTLATGALVFTSDFTATGGGAKTLLLKGGNNDIIQGKIVDSGGGVTTLGKTGGGTWIISGANTFSGGTTVGNGNLRLDGPAATLGLGNVTVLATANSLEIATGVLNGISDAATLTLAGGGVAGTADAGFARLGNNIDEFVTSLVLGGVAQVAGTYGSTTSGATNQLDEYFSGKGIITVVPEPSAWALALSGMILLPGLQRFRRKTI